jgi:hypothetical protein
VPPDAIWNNEHAGNKAIQKEEIRIDAAEVGILF